MLWSIMPEQLVLAGLEETPNLIEGQIGEFPCRLRYSADGSYSIERLNSTNPKDFLRADLQPGRRIFLHK